MCQDIALSLYSWAYFKDLRGCADTYRGMWMICWSLKPELFSTHCSVHFSPRHSLCTSLCAGQRVAVLPIADLFHLFFLLWCDREGNCEKILIFTEGDTEISHPKQNFQSCFSRKSCLLMVVAMGITSIHRAKMLRPKTPSIYTLNIPPFQIYCLTQSDVLNRRT